MASAHLAIDIGASGGTVQFATIGEDSFDLEEIARFDNGPVRRADGRYVWPIDRLTSDVVAAIQHADESVPRLDSIGIDTWGVDVGLLAEGDPIQDPYAYRDPTVYGTLGDVLASVDRRTIFEATGISHWQARTTLPALYHLAHREPDVIAAADTMLMMPQLVATRLGGRPCIDPTIASTTQLFDPRTGNWATDLCARLGIPIDLLPRPMQPGTRIGTLDPNVAGHLESDPAIVLPASHDTASAVAALPFRAGGRAFLATGTVFILGVERSTPMFSEPAYQADLSNEIGIDGTIRLLANLNNGFFLLEECRAVWRDQDVATDYPSLLEAARNSEPFRSLIDPEAAVFDSVGTMPARIRQFCARTGQPVPESIGEITRCILESLAGNVAVRLDDVLAVAGQQSDRLHVCGGGVRNDLFCQLVADATGMEVLTGPAEAAAIGNLLVQARTFGSIDSITAGRRLVENTLGVERYRPTEDDGWSDALDRFERLQTRE